MQVARSPRPGEVDRAVRDLQEISGFISNGSLANSNKSTPPATPAEPKQVRDVHGFSVEEEHVGKYKQFIEAYAPLMRHRKTLWGTYLARHPRITKSEELKKLIRNGIPHELRKQVWLGVTNAMRKSPPGYFEDILRIHAKEQSTATKQIDLDIKRTFPGHPDLDTVEGPQKLRKVLVAYSWRNPNVGYCQSMNFISAMLLVVFRMTDEEAFAMLCHIVEDLLPDKYYTNTMLSSQVDQRVFAELVKRKLPRIAEHFEKQNLQLPLISTAWFLCLYVTATPSETTLRVWDVFFNEGSKILFRVGLALLKLHERSILSALDTSDMFNVLRDIPVTAFNCELLLNTAFHDIGSFPMKAISRQRQEFEIVVRKEIADIEHQKEEFKKKRAQEGK